HQQDIITRAAEHKGAAFVEILQNCNVYNDGAFASLTDKETKADTQLVLEHGKPMIFGKNKDRGIRLKGLTPRVATSGNGICVSDPHVTDETDAVLGFLLSRMATPAFPSPIGVIPVAEKSAFDALMNYQTLDVMEKSWEGILENLVH